MDPITLLTALLVVLVAVAVLYLLCSGALGGMMAGVLGTPWGWAGLLVLVGASLALLWPR